MPAKSPDLLTSEQRAAFVRIPDDLSDREIACYYTFTPDELAVIKRHRRAANRLGFAVQLAVLRFPGRIITEIPSIPARMLAYIAHQVGVDGAAFAHYGTRENTIYEHLDEIRAVFGFRNYDRRAMHQLMQYLLPLAMESDRPIPLVEAALDLLRSMKVIAPSMTTLEQLIVRVLRRGERRVQQLLLQPLTADHKAVTWLVGNEELANGERVGLGQREERGLKRGGVIRGVVASRLIAGVPGWFSLHDSACRCHEGSPPQVKAVERSVAPRGHPTLWYNRRLQ